MSGPDIVAVAHRVLARRVVTVPGGVHRQGVSGQRAGCRVLHTVRTARPSQGRIHGPFDGAKDFFQRSLGADAVGLGR